MRNRRARRDWTFKLLLLVMVLLQLRHYMHLSLDRNLIVSRCCSILCLHLKMSRAGSISACTTVYIKPILFLLYRKDYSQLSKKMEEWRSSMGWKWFWIMLELSVTLPPPRWSWCSSITSSSKVAQSHYKYTWWWYWCCQKSNTRDGTQSSQTLSRSSLPPEVPNITICGKVVVVTFKSEEIKQQGDTSSMIVTRYGGWNRAMFIYFVLIISFFLNRLWVVSSLNAELSKNCKLLLKGERWWPFTALSQRPLAPTQRCCRRGTTTLSFCIFMDKFIKKRRPQRSPLKGLLSPPSPHN